jgi:hypothetical protein
MNTEKTYQSIIKIVSNYSAQLAMVDEHIFQAKPPIGGWSLSEVYSHIFDSSLLSLMAIEKCTQGLGEQKKTLFVAKLLLLIGRFPLAKAPSKIADRVKKITPIDAQQLITDFELQLSKNYSSISKAEATHKIKHPRLGYLNAKQWLRFIEIHLNHHLHQLHRINKSFKK